MSATVTPGLSDVGLRLEHALSRLQFEDAHLLEVDINEPCIAHRLALYLESEFWEWDVDCEYNRDEVGPKQLSLPEEKYDDWKDTRVYPDIIVQERGCNDSNLLIIDIKLSSNKNFEAYNFDKRKIESYIEQLCYEYGVFIVIATDDSIEEKWKIEWFQKPDAIPAT